MFVQYTVQLYIKVAIVEVSAKIEIAEMENKATLHFIEARVFNLVPRSDKTISQR